MRLKLLLCLLLLALAPSPALLGQAAQPDAPLVSITMSHYDLGRTGANTHETILNTSNVNAEQFGKLFSLPVQGDIYAQPLVVSDVAIPGQGAHNVVYTATMHNNVYAFDADTAGPPLWSVNLGPIFDANISDDLPGHEDGVLSTPAIDLTTQTIYVVSHHNGSPPVHKLHALDIGSGAEKFGGPVVIQGGVAGTGAGSSNGWLAFDSHQHLQRPGLLLTQGRVVITFGSTGNDPPYHGWVFAYDVTDLQKAPLIWSVTPDGEGGGIWQSGTAPAADSEGNVYIVSGNGSFSASSGGFDYGDSFIKLTLADGLRPVDFFTPYNQEFLFDHDQDLGVSGAVLLPGTPYVMGGGKSCPLYVVDTHNMGQFQAGSDSQVHQSFCGFSSRLHNAPIVWNSPTGTRVYIWSDSDYLKAYRLVSEMLDPVPISTSDFVANGRPSGIAALSSNGSEADTGIIWAIDNTGNFRAVAATDLTRVLWTNMQYPERDSLETVAKFCPPTVANGKVYVATRANKLNVYGLLDAPTLQPAVLSTAAAAETSVPIIGTGQVTGQVIAMPTTVDLSFEGTIDWVHVGLRSPEDTNRKRNPTAKLGDITLIGQQARLRNEDNAAAFSWSDGAPATTETGTSAGIYSTTLETGFGLTAPADTHLRTLKVYVGVGQAQGELTATLSDQSAAPYVDDSLVNWQTMVDGVYTLTYAAASSGQTLTVNWVMINGSGNIRLQAAALAPGGASP